MLEYAVERKIINISPMHNLKINTKKLLVKEKKTEAKRKFFIKKKYERLMNGQWMIFTIV